jgi:hypothetical protein
VNVKEKFSREIKTFIDREKKSMCGYKTSKARLILLLGKMQPMT